MTDREINVAIAEACGWKFDGAVAFCPDGWKMHSYINNPKVEFTPDYCHDLNAMHDAESFLEKNQLQYLYVSKLYTIVVPFTVQPCRATARQRAEAFLRTVGKWKEAAE